MLVITKKINAMLEEKGLSQYKFAQLIDYSRGALGSMIKGRDAFPEDVIEKMAPVLGVCADEIRGWIMADKFSCDTLKLAAEIKEQKLTDDDKLILTAKIDEILQQRQISRTALSKLIKHSQSGLNRVIIGKEPLSKSVLAKLSKACEISEDEIKSWVVADKYSLKAIETAYKIKLTQN